MVAMPGPRLNPRQLHVLTAAARDQIKRLSTSPFTITCQDPALADKHLPQTVDGLAHRNLLRRAVTGPDGWHLITPSVAGLDALAERGLNHANGWSKTPAGAAAAAPR